jgi:hypothetical protein
MVRNIVLVKLAAGQDPAAVAKAQQAFLSLNCHRAYDQDEEHNRARAGLLPMTEQIARVQFEMP